MFKLFAIACLLAVAAGAPYGGYAVDSYPRYSFNYAVSDPHTGDNKAQSEHRDGGYVKGSYSLAEPDGTLRVVDYSADPHTGFNAVVKRLGPAAHPQIVAPVVTKPIAPIVAPAISHWGGWAGHGSWGINGLGAWGGAGLGLGAHGLGLGAHGLGLGAHGLGLGAYSNLGLAHGGLGLGAHGGWSH